MSATPPAASTGSHASTATQRAQSHPARPGAAKEGGGDLFSSLLALLSATRDAPALAADDSEALSELPGQGLPQASDAANNPLAALLGWPGAAPQTLAALPGSGAAPTAQALTGLAGNATAQAASAANGSATGLPLQGMTLLATPAAPDADTLAAIAEATASPPALTGDAAQPPAGSGIASGTAGARASVWRSTVGTAQAAASATAQALQTGPQAHGDKVQSAHQALVAQTRSTVALDERFGQAQASESPLAPAGGVAAAGSSAGTHAQGGGAGSPGAMPDTSTPDTAAERTELPGTDTAYADSARETDDTAAAHWGTPTLRHASLRVGEAGEDAIDIQLAMAGQELRVDFRTDSAEARASLTQDASGSLGELLQRSGIQLGSVSVGAQSQQQGEPGRAHEQPASPSLGRGRPATDNDAAGTPAPVVRPRSDGSRPLDLFV